MVTVDNDPFTAPDAAQARAHRNYAALLRIAERHAGTNSRRRRYAHPDVPDAYEAATLVMAPPEAPSWTRVRSPSTRPT
ncbi:hypothetical protein V2I01_29435 [Micromonospora sp. BRA006-A]|nr:hypothetical protein [Micromonospora sp. BRA006-A]